MNIKYIAAFGAGFLAGGLVVWLRSKKVFEEMEQEHYVTIDHRGEEWTDEDFPEDGDPEKYGESMQKYKNVVEKTNYAGGAKVITNEPKKPSLSEMMNKEFPEPVVDPFRIPVESYLHEMDHYAKVTLYYYGADDVLMDEDETVLPDKATYIGKQAVQDLKDDDIDDNPIYIRNTKLEIDYEVTALPGAYAEEVLQKQTPPDMEDYSE